MARRSSSAARHRGDPHKAVGHCLNAGANLFVLDLRDGEAQFRLQAVKDCRRADRQHLKIEATRIHIVQAALEIPSTARERRHPRATEFEACAFVIYRLEPEPGSRRRILQQANGLWLNDMRVDINGAGCGHSNTSSKKEWLGEASCFGPAT
jgi:hypothetical protein